ncbi:MAG TPA: extracellular solute-binding protein, partial [Limnochordia bacterium]|nr:extracellular solute-binding protein [Limnochordia bacterium]
HTIWDDRFPIAHQYATDRGVIYGMPHDLASAGIVYDLTAFENAGIDTDPYALKNWDDRRDAAKKLTERDGARVTRYGITGGITDAQSLAYWVEANGGSLYSPDFTQATVDTPEVHGALDYWLELRDGLGIMGGNIQNGDSAMNTNYGNFAAFNLEALRPDLKFRYTSMPPGPMGSKRNTVTWSNMISIVKTTKHPDLAWEYVKFYTSPETREAMLRILHRIGPNPSLYQTATWRSLVAAHPYMSVFGDMAQVGGLWPFVGTSTAIAAVTTQVDAIVQHKTSIESGLAAAAKQATALLQQG